MAGAVEYQLPENFEVTPMKCLIELFESDDIDHRTGFKLPDSERSMMRVRIHKVGRQMPDAKQVGEYICGVLAAIDKKLPGKGTLPVEPTVSEVTAKTVAEIFKNGEMFDVREGDWAFMPRMQGTTINSNGRTFMFCFIADIQLIER